ncbi:MAG: outer membrane beta-barrel protein [Myxococcaceae bacterium]|nr:outer membrane beta-barrel protein [Myxococcaceae bacterium]
MGTLSLVVGLLAFAPGEALASEESEESAATAPQGAAGGLYDTGPQERSPMLSFFGIVPWWYGFGIGAGARYEMPIVPEGFIPTLNDSFELELGGDVWYADWGYLGTGYSYTGLAIPVEGRWTFHFTPKLAAYGKLGLGWHFIFWGDSVTGSSFSGGGLYWNSATGVLYKLGDSFWLRGELGYTGLKLGAGFKF